MKIKHTLEGETVIRGPVRDQASLHGMLNKVAKPGVRTDRRAPHTKITKHQDPPLIRRVLMFRQSAEKHFHEFFKTLLKTEWETKAAG